MRAVSEGTRATAVAQGFSFAPALTLSSGRAFAAKDMRLRSDNKWPARRLCFSNC